MTLADLIPLALKLSVVLLVFSLGLKTDVSQLTYLIRRPGRLVRSLLAMNVIMPLFAAALVSVFNLTHAVTVILVALALSPVPPALPGKQVKKGGREAYAVSLLVCAAVFAVVSVPLNVEVIERLAGVPLEMAPATVAGLVFASVLAPLGVGLLVRTMAAGLAERIAEPLSKAASAVMLLAVVALLVVAWRPVIGQVGDGTLAAIAVFVLVGMAVGWMLGGPEPADRTVLALSTATRHPGVALAIVSANYPKNPEVGAALLLYLVVGGVLSGVYLAVLKQRAK